VSEEEEEEEVMAEAEAMADMEGGRDGRLPQGCSPVRVGGGVGVGGGAGGGHGAGEDEVSKLEEVVRPQPDHNLHLPVGFFLSGILSTPGQGFLQFDTSRGSQEQLDIQPMEEAEEDERPQSAEETRLEANLAARSTSKPFARKKMKAPRKGRSSLRPLELERILVLWS
jgi:hypothetical protein